MSQEFWEEFIDHIDISLETHELFIEKITATNPTEAIVSNPPGLEISSVEAMPVVPDEHQYCSKNDVTPGATKFTLSTWGSYKLRGDNVVYTIKSGGSALCHCSARNRPLGFLKTNFYGFRRSLITDEKKRNLL